VINFAGTGTRSAVAARMDSTMFSVKRAFLRTVSFGRQALEPFGLTPARFDLMFLLRNNPYRPQGELWRILGLHPSTVSKMLKRLEQLDLVWRGPNPDDGRQTLCRLSPDGEKALEAAIAELLANGAIEAFVADSIGGNRLECKRSVAVLNLQEGLLRLRMQFLDSARLLYLFDPADWAGDGHRAMPYWPSANHDGKDVWTLIAEN
jgi:DNA-binding MarR family transcriptional regulator